MRNQIYELAHYAISAAAQAVSSDAEGLNIDYANRKDCPMENVNSVLTLTISTSRILAKYSPTSQGTIPCT